MMAQKYDNSGILFRNQDKDKEDANPKWPDIKGSITVDGKDYWLSGWQKDGDKGKFYSLSVEPKQQQRQAERSHTSGGRNDDPDIPFNDPYKGRLAYL